MRNRSFHLDKTMEMEESVNIDLDVAPNSASSPCWKPRHKVLVGVIGGIGPAASAYLYQTIVQLRASAAAAADDDDHIPLLLYSNPQIPNNNAAVRGHGPSSVPAMVYTARALQRAGATHIVLPCNTAHVFAEALQQELRRFDDHTLQLIHMLELTAHKVLASLRRRDNSLNEDDPDSFHHRSYRVGLMGTIGTLQSKIYHKVLEKVATAASLNGRHTCSIQVIPPADTTIVQECICRIKAGDREDVLQPLLEQLQSFSEVDAIVLGCTELPLVLTPAAQRCSCVSVPVLDPMQLLAKEIIRLTAESEVNGAVTDCE